MQDDSLAEQSSYVMEHSIGTDMEFSTINRLLADFNINRDSSVTQRRSPLKSLKITGDSLNAGQTAAAYDAERAPSTMANTRENQGENGGAGPSSSTVINADDTLEEIEYVLDLGLNYVPKRLINEIKMKSEVVKQECKTEHNEDADADEQVYGGAAALIDNDEVIMVDSSPENSFTTTMTTAGFKSAFESVENTFYTAKSILNNMSVVSIDSDESDEQTSNSEKSTEQSTQDTIEQSLPSQENQPEKSSILQKADITEADSMDMSTSTQIDNSAVAAEDLKMPNFNDSLERVEYMMAQAQKMMNNKAKPCAPLCQVEAKKTPVSQTKLKPKVLTPNGVPLKKGTPKHLTPNRCDPFKRPDQRNARSPFTAKAASASKAQAPTQGQSRIPTKIPGSLHKPQFRHIASPIAAYINNTPEVPLLKTIKPMRNLLSEDFNKACKSNSSLDESTQSVESLPTKSALPRKMYISAQQRKVNMNVWRNIFVHFHFSNLF